jgi:competence protein ComEC
VASSLRALALAALLLVAPLAAAGDALRVHFLDIGQGDAILIVSPTGKTVLVDAGPRGGDRVVRHALASEGRTVIDLAVFSHAHADHIGGMARVVEAVDVKRVLDPGFDHTSATYRQLLQTLAKHNVPVSIARDGRKIDLGGGAALEILAPADPLLTGTRSDANTNSIVLRLTHGSMSLLLTGDAEEATERRLLESPERLASTILKVAHHGSRHSSIARFLAAVTPVAAVISCGLDNKYGHPHPETLERLKAIGSGVFRTDLHGTVSLESTGSSWHFKTTRGPPVKIPDHGVVVAKATAQAQTPMRINVNGATPDDLQSLPGIGKVKARAIVDYRSAKGPFRNVSDLQRVRGIGPGILAKIKDLVTVNPTIGTSPTRREP